jgi:DNA-directed RNA polymerase specialized sigma24 family protein
MATLEAEGLSHREIGEQVGRPKSTVGWALRNL